MSFILQESNTGRPPRNAMLPVCSFYRHTKIVLGIPRAIYLVALRKIKVYVEYMEVQ